LENWFHADEVEEVVEIKKNRKEVYNIIMERINARGFKIKVKILESYT